MSTTPNNEKSDKTVPFTTSDDAAKGGLSGNGSSTLGNTSGVELVNRVAQSAHAAIDKLANQATPAVQHLQKSLEGTGEMLHQRADQLRSTGDEWMEGARDGVRANPLVAVGTAFALGLLIARLAR
ncbi:hypothetical protein [Roseateles terrae]|uniref:ElaB/YqjD/DUF883 family membrane-anchored ribosome-binding protein n=1 Tax=Roseateles terrae TaxID=431060 RepID=A0ABR6GNA6_9BURK|nr:hypothetical protein [Roseateles terrae]MBB3192719.1 ElaB/YqjD/DUF883 family membrane-anchored ribosome-binding protein [Roseateles terrae]OWQ90000.1 hypothetical protein CDN98_05820 [Roseateles terrae]